MKIAIQSNVWSAERHQDLPGLLADIAAAGYDGLEIGAHRLDLSLPKEFKHLLDDHRLGLAGLHIHGELHNPAAIDPLFDFYTQAAAFAAVAGASFMLISGKPKEGGKSLDEMASEVQVLTKVSRLCSQSGVRLCYHNHYWEIQDQMRELEYLVAHTSAEHFGLALDVAWVHRTGLTPSQVIDTYRERIQYIHIKDTLPERFMNLGEGQVDFLAIKTAIRGMPLPWLTVERDEVLPDPLASAQACRSYLRALFP